MKTTITDTMNTRTSDGTGSSDRQKPCRQFSTDDLGNPVEEEEDDEYPFDDDGD